LKPLRICLTTLLIYLSISVAVAADLQRIKLGLQGESFDFPVYANHDMSSDLSRIREVIIIIHGVNRNADQYFNTAQSLLKDSGRDEKEILLLAPKFPGLNDPRQEFDELPIWKAQDWAVGLAATNRPTGLSAFDVLDNLLLKITDKTDFPSVTSVNVAGHSAGAQLVQRYAVLNHVDEQIRARSLDLRYIVANPSSFLYFTTQRPVEKTFKDFPAEQCPAFNQYRYGMDNLPAYSTGISSQGLFKRYAYRNVVFLMGGSDNDPAHKYLDTSCPAMAQGLTRLERAQAYVRYERFLAGRAAKINHLAYEVIAIGHDQKKMFGSVCAMNILFQSRPDKESRAATCQPYLF
jgi:pimeloyl-ACP methyl ester carboxylesterase